MSMPARRKSFEWSVDYTNRTPSTFRPPQQLHRFFLLSLSLVVSFIFLLKIIRTPGATFFESLLRRLHEPRGLAAAISYLLLILWIVTPLEKKFRALLKKDDLSFLKKVPEAEDLKSRNVKVALEPENRRIHINISLKHKSGTEEKMDFNITPELCQKMGMNRSLEDVFLWIDADDIGQGDNRHFALLLQLIFYGRSKDLKGHLLLMSETKNDLFRR